MRNQIIVIVNQKGGVGKTTTAINLSSAIADMGKKILVVDFDPQGNCSSGFGVKSNGSTIYEAMMGKKTIDECIFPTKVENCFVVPADVNLTGASIELVDIEGRDYFLKNVLEPLKSKYDYIFIDCPPSLGILTINGLAASDSVLIPIQTEFFALEGLSQLINTINLVKKGINKNLKIEGVLLTMLDKRTHLTEDVTNNVISYFGKSVYKTMIPRNVRLAEAPSFGIPVTMHDNSCVGAKAYLQLAEEFINGKE